MSRTSRDVPVAEAAAFFCERSSGTTEGEARADGGAGLGLATAGAGAATGLGLVATGAGAGAAVGLGLAAGGGVDDFAGPLPRSLRPGLDTGAGAGAGALPATGALESGGATVPCFAFLDTGSLSGASPSIGRATTSKPCSAALAADGAHVGAIWTQHLQSVVLFICHHDVALAVNRHAFGILELPYSVPFAADCAHVGAIWTHHLHVTHLACDCQCRSGMVSCPHS